MDKRWREWKGVNNADQELVAAHFPQIRLFKVYHKIALRPAANSEADGWTAVTPNSFSAVAYFFGRELHQRYQIPVLIESSWSGTIAEAWVSADSLKRFPEFTQSIDSMKMAVNSKLVSDPNTATVLFNGMIAPLVPYQIKGAIWYQGESNTDRPVPNIGLCSPP